MRDLPAQEVPLAPAYLFETLYIQAPPLAWSTIAAPLYTGCFASAAASTSPLPSLAPLRRSQRGTPDETQNGEQRRS